MAENAATDGFKQAISFVMERAKDQCAVQKVDMAVANHDGVMVAMPCTDAIIAKANDFVKESAKQCADNNHSATDKSMYQGKAGNDTMSITCVGRPAYVTAPEGKKGFSIE